jgi:hypothetical protein
MLNHISKLITFAVLIATMIAGCDAALSPEQKQEKARVAVGMDASVAAAIAVSATRSCQVVGVNDIELCTQLKGSLIAEQTAQMSAKMAKDKANMYWDKCKKDFSQDYCLTLLQRALDIENRKPRTQE